MKSQPDNPVQPTNMRKVGGSSRMDLLLVLFFVFGNLFWVPFAYQRWGASTLALLTYGGIGEILLLIVATILAFAISISISFRKKAPPSVRESPGRQQDTAANPETVYKNVVFGVTTVVGTVVVLLLLAVALVGYLAESPGLAIGAFALLALALPLAIALPRALRQAAVTVPQQEAWVVYRLGRFARSLHAGPGLLIPWIDQVAKRIELRWKRIEITANRTPTRDKIPVDVPGILLWQPDPTFPERHYLEVQNIEESLSSVAEASLKQIASVSTIEELLEAAPHTIERLNTIMLDLVSKWGVKFALRISDVILPPELSTAISAEKQAKYDAAAKKARADAEAYVQKQYKSALKAQYPDASDLWLGEFALHLSTLDTVRTVGQAGAAVNVLPLGDLFSRRTGSVAPAQEATRRDQGGTE